ncbi:hypothetical protein J2S40_001657 [Nocardioides luteus]|uniref:Uncharacterized protein n=1 Tax=Nocardioides luteus TaxID=1844 RepID=A0ABQ5T0I8_9ACTN|nr:hypothetical protein [Nocardioides luteus]MDR7310599.1 hypothetical protein [Nocardioides luteus]GGR41838.1 hypothetical protein GCM10010197_03970 [Nocardioides luteus]GLJ69621.1 hypothetical protein GCM10017579_36570 [Nocardioides luteus]
MSEHKNRANRRRRPPSMNELNKIVATNQAMTNGDDVVNVLTAQGIDTEDPTVRRRLRKAKRTIRKLNKRLSKGWF